MGDFCPGKKRWPELVGTEARIAEKIIQKENPNVNIVQIFLFGSKSPISMEFCCSRVRLLVNINGVIVGIPSIG
ncbi:Proteinase inhibitor I-B, partial [Cucurbita argyrosperma subsp. sororia]